MISIITPTTRPNELIKLKKAIKNQTYKKFNHIIIEDTAKLGSAVVRNQALKKTNGKYIAFIDDDCIPDENWLKDLKKFLDKNPDISACSGLVYPPEDANIITRINYHKSMSDEHTGKIEKEGIIDVDHVSCTNCMWKKKDLDKLKGFDIRLKRSQDLDLSLRARKMGMKFKAIPSGIVYHNYPSTVKESLRKSFIKGTGGKFILKKHPEFFKKRKYIIYAFPLYLLLFPILFLLPFLFCRSGFKIYKKEKSIKLFFLAILLEYVKYHFNLFGIWWGILCR